MAKAKAKTSADTAANLGFGAKLWLNADKLRNNMDSEQFVEVHGKLIGDIGRSYRDVPIRNGHFVQGVEAQILHRCAG